MEYSIINYVGEKKGFWLQNYTGTLKEAKKRAEETKKANGDNIQVAITEKIKMVTPIAYGLIGFREKNILSIL